MARLRRGKGKPPPSPGETVPEAEPLGFGPEAEAELEPTPMLEAGPPVPPAPGAVGEQPSTAEVAAVAAAPEGQGPAVRGRRRRSAGGAVIAVARRELGALFLSPVGWVIAALLVLPVGALGYLGSIAGPSAGFGPIFGVLSFLMLLYIPAFTMRSFAEERRLGTLELLLTQPVRDAEVVLGKWLGAYLFFVFSIAFTLVYVLLFAIYLPHQDVTAGGFTFSIGRLDWGTVLSGYLGLLLAGAALTAIGVLLSSLTANQVIALVAGWVLLLLLWYLGGFVALLLAPPYDQFFAYLGGANRFEAFARGLVRVRDVVFFVSLAVGSLLLASRVLDSRRWRA